MALEEPTYESELYDWVEDLYQRAEILNVWGMFSEHDLKFIDDMHELSAKERILDTTDKQRTYIHDLYQRLVCEAVPLARALETD